MAFLGLFGNYDKPGPGVDKDEPKKAAPVRFFEILWRKLSKLVQLNLTFMIPFIAVIALMVGVFLLPIPHFLYATSFFGVLDLYILYAVTLPLILLSPFTCGLAYVTRNFAREEHAFVWSDFWDAVKNNWKPALLNGVIVYLAELRVQRQRDLICIVLIRIRIILNIKAKRFISSHHRKRFVVNIASNFTLCHFYNDVISLLFRDIWYSCNIKMAGTPIVFTKMCKCFNAKRLQRCIISMDDLCAALKQARIPFQLFESDSRHDISHVTFIPRANDIIFPSAQFSFC